MLGFVPLRWLSFVQLHNGFNVASAVHSEMGLEPYMREAKRARAERNQENDTNSR